MEKTLHVINQMETDGVIGRYAIGGAVAAARYIEPMQTYDLHVLVIFPSTKSSLLLLSPIYDYLTQRGYLVPGETVAIEGWAVQFLPAYNQLVEEALERAVEVKYGVTPTRVLSPEYLAAIMVQTGRAKDHARLIQFYEDNVVNQRALEDIIQRHGLELKWNNFQAKYLSKG